ncbi:hypothetical protein LTR36_004675 [Oleoguttula mirabilis]|uniref:Heterokaryon incompatibility domain-containing protein n=1 Tax=Oleoguttula mirabilis TaxID=1507867 RepID=A0AAV9JFJ4_9PEZI|nr:hypothetical protein LTR36_004675 [Oleoguttula mirabilis]
MRLLNTTDLTFQDFYETALEPYAALSHCWTTEPGQHEVTYQQLLADHQELLAGYQFYKPSAEHNPEAPYGWRKIWDCCRLARDRGLQWVWIDTCCIDKSSSAELSETINSMYRWYESATECYVFLDDVHITTRVDTVASQADTSPFSGDTEKFCASRWFTRGWTLQELLAPTGPVLFYDDVREYFGTLTALAATISQATGIPLAYLTKRTAIGKACVAQRMCWASRRTTTRLEDMAYSLLGIFDINMPLLYGEGAKAFQRLQLAIIEQSNDETIFVWGLDPGGECPSTSDESTATGKGMLAASPASFINSGTVRPRPRPAWLLRSIERPPHHLTNRGISFHYVGGLTDFWNEGVETVMGLKSSTLGSKLAY